MGKSESHKTECLSDPTLRSFLAFELRDQEAEQAENHLSKCTHCQIRLESVSAGEAMWTETRKLLQEHEPIDHVDAHCEHTVAADYLKSILGPTDDPQMLGRIGTYEVSGIIGVGGTGIVLKAFDAKLNRYVAIKVLAPNFASNASARARFEREGKAVAAVSHDHVVPVHAVDEFRGLPYLVMQYVPGKSLQQRIDSEGPLAIKEIVRIAMQVSQALACAHSQGVIHRDVKPANILLENGVERVRVSDFGLAQVADDVSMTRSGVIAGTPQYMSPEQTRGESLDGRSDLFSLGSVMYAMGTGHPPFRAETPLGIIHRIGNDEVRPVREHNPDIPLWLVKFVHQLLRKSPDDRFNSAEEVAHLLSAELSHLQQPRSTKAPERPWMEKRAERRWWELALPIIGLLALVGIISSLLSSGADVEQIAADLRAANKLEIESSPDLNIAPTTITDKNLIGRTADKLDVDAATSKTPGKVSSATYIQLKLFVQDKTEPTYHVLLLPNGTCIVNEKGKKPYQFGSEGLFEFVQTAAKELQSEPEGLGGLDEGVSPKHSDVTGSALPTKLLFSPWTDSGEGTLYMRANWRDGKQQQPQLAIIRLDPQTGTWQRLIDWGSQLRISRDGENLVLHGENPESKQKGTWTCDWQGRNFRRVATWAGKTTWLPDNQLLVDSTLFGLRDDSWTKLRQQTTNNVSRGVEAEAGLGGLDDSETDATEIDELLSQTQLGHVVDCSADGGSVLRVWNLFERRGAHQIHLADGLEGSVQLVQQGGGTIKNAQLSPSGDQIAFIRNIGRIASLHSYDRTTGETKQLMATGVDGKNEPDYFCWSPDGTKLAVATFDWLTKAERLVSEDGKPFKAPVPEANVRLIIHDVTSGQETSVNANGMTFLRLESVQWAPPIR